MLKTNRIIVNQSTQVGLVNLLVLVIIVIHPSGWC